MNYAKICCHGNIHSVPTDPSFNLRKIWQIQCPSQRHYWLIRLKGHIALLNMKYVFKNSSKLAASVIDLFSLYVSLPHFRPRDGTLENHCFQILKYLRAYE